MFRPPSLLLLALIAALIPPTARAERLDFNRDIRPILSENCFYCHGQDPNHRKADLRLDDREVAVKPAKSGDVAIVPGHPEKSSLVERILTTDAEDQMPPPKSNRKVSPEQREILRRWIAEGAEYKPHWAFIPPARPALPAVKQTDWPKNEIDRFILARLEQSGLAPAPEAAPEAWLRRASFDLTGLPPTLAELDAFRSEVAARGEAAYATAADRLLASPHFGERLAIDWLDAARYADTHGFNNDSARTMWRWRDWVIDAFNANLPYDRFITDQLAGDLLPNPTLEEKIATGFCRNHVINSEGGIIDEEYRVEYVVDRVRTMSMAWLGLTMECSRCHDHKFDAITQKDFYRMFAFFNQVSEFGEDGRVANAAPLLASPTREQAAQLQAEEKSVAGLTGKLQSTLDAWQWEPAEQERMEQLASAAKAKGGKDLVNAAIIFPNGKPALVPGVAGEAWLGEGKSALARVEAKGFDFEKEGGVTLSLWVRLAAGNPPDVALLSSQNYEERPAAASYAAGEAIRLVGGEIEVRLNQRFPAYAVRVVSEGVGLRVGEWRQVAVMYAGGKKAEGVRIFVDGKEVATRTLADDLHGGLPKVAFLVGSDVNASSAKFRGELEGVRLYQRALGAGEVRAGFEAQALPYAAAWAAQDEAGPRERRWLAEAALRAGDAGWQAAEAERDSAWEKHLAARRALPTTMVMEEMPAKRPTFVLRRGQYDMPGDPVEAGVPEKLLGPWPQGAPANRLGLARWLTRPDQPLTARVVVNRFWAQLFGTGIVKTLEDFGVQGEWPSHPELLDWMAREFIDGGWNVKALFKTMVLSATYRQSSAATPELVARDPENRLLAHGPRFRLPAELIRDQALTISGLLDPRIGGPSVFPFQPPTLYTGVVVGADYPGTKWVESQGGDLFRRSLYTFWKRTVPHPVMLTFDAPDREFCSVRRSRTNTPLQALVLQNEPAYLEASRGLGARMILEGGSRNEDRAALGFRLCTSRAPDPRETEVLASALAKLSDDYTRDPKSAHALLIGSISARHPELPPAQLAAATCVASMLLNLDETLNK